MRYPVLLLSLALTACAATGPEQRGLLVETTVRGEPLAGTNCTVSTAAGTWNVVTPAVVDVGQPSGDLRVVCSRPGFRTAEVIHRGYAPGGGPTIGLGFGGGSGNVGASVGIGVPFGRTAVQYPARISVDLYPQ